MSQPDFIRIPYQQMLDRFHAVLLKEGMDEGKAAVCASIFATNSVEGIYTHGINRFAKFIKFTREGHIKFDQQPAFVSRFGGIEQWNGNLGPGVLNALSSTTRAMELSSEYGMGCVALANTNHWMRGGYYGWHAAKKGYVFIGWTNTLANMPAWGGVNSKLGNNPLVIAVPFQGDAVVVDTAMSQYSFGALDLYRAKKQKLPTPGGYDAQGNLTDDPDAIRAAQRVLPIGYWKGAGLSLLLDILATILSAGLSTSEITKLPAEYGMSQIFIAIDIKKLGNYPSIETAIQQIIDDYHTSIPDRGVTKVRYPGEKVGALREENMKLGIPVEAKIWEEILSL